MFVFIFQIKNNSQVCCVVLSLNYCINIVIFTKQKTAECATAEHKLRSLCRALEDSINVGTCVWL